MTEILRSPPQLPSSPSSITRITPINKNQRSFTNYNESLFESREEDHELSVLAAVLTVFRKSVTVVGCRSARSGVIEEQLMEIGCPTNVRHVAHVTFDRFNGFLGLPVEFEPEVPTRPPSASTRVFGVSTESMQLSFDNRVNCVPTILLMMQRRLYTQGGLQAEGIFRINAENGQEEYVRDQLNNGWIPDNIDVHCLAGLMKAWFRELPKGVLDSLSAEQVMQAHSEDECTQLSGLLPPTEAALLDWAINLMADVAEFEHLNKMNARNIAMVFAPNMSQMSDPLTALMYAVQVMNFLKTLILKTLREREESSLEAYKPIMHFEPSDEDGHNRRILGRKNLEAGVVGKKEEVNIAKEVDLNQAKLGIDEETPCFLSSLENMKDEGNNNSSVGNGRNKSRIRRNKSSERRISNNVKKGSRKHTPQPAIGISISTSVNSETERGEARR